MTAWGVYDVSQSVQNCDYTGAAFNGITILPVARMVKIGSIIVTESRMLHVLNNHTVNGINNVGKSIFANNANINTLIKNAENVAPVLQNGGNYSRVVDAGKVIGIDRSTGSITTKYTVITDKNSNLITAFPGAP